MLAGGRYLPHRCQAMSRTPRLLDPTMTNPNKDRAHDRPVRRCPAGCMCFYHRKITVAALQKRRNGTVQMQVVAVKASTTRSWHRYSRLMKLDIDQSSQQRSHSRRYRCRNARVVNVPYWRQNRLIQLLPQLLLHRNRLQLHLQHLILLQQIPCPRRLQISTQQQCLGLKIDMYFRRAGKSKLVWMESEDGELLECDVTRLGADAEDDGCFAVREPAPFGNVRGSWSTSELYCTREIGDAFPDLQSEFCW